MLLKSPDSPGPPEAFGASLGSPEASTLVQSSQSSPRAPQALPELLGLLRELPKAPRSSPSLPQSFKAPRRSPEAPPADALALLGSSCAPRRSPRREFRGEAETLKGARPGGGPPHGRGVGKKTQSLRFRFCESPAADTPPQPPLVQGAQTLAVIYGRSADGSPKP